MLHYEATFCFLLKKSSLILSFSISGLVIIECLYIIEENKEIKLWLIDTNKKNFLREGKKKKTIGLDKKEIKNNFFLILKRIIRFK